MVLARAGLEVAVLERSGFPRFHIGESFLPANYDLLRELGLLGSVERLAHVPKFGAEFGMGHGGATTCYHFDIELMSQNPRTFNLERAAFDKLLLDRAVADGAQLYTGAAAKEVTRLEDGEVCVTTDQGPVRGRYVIDASGQSTALGRHLGSRRKIDHPDLGKVAYFAHYDHVWRHRGREGGYPGFALCDEGWFWLIPLNETRTSVGLVMDAAAARSVGVPSRKMLAWGIERCPMIRDRMRQAVGPDDNYTAADFTYVCGPVAGPGYFLVGDAAAFIDPVFSTGVHLAMSSGRRAAEHVIGIIHHHRPPRAQRKRYIAYWRKSLDRYLWLITHFYDHAFRELFLEGQGPLGVHRALLSILTGHAVPEAPWSVRWRLELLEWFIKIQRHIALTPRRARFSLLAQEVSGGQVRREAVGSYAGLVDASSPPAEHVGQPT